ncbi:DUF302 domain-containing protein [Marinobacter sp. CA1]|uniref:DUF302 domain-containing protein n=1 Tax=Marinobacter sp. CA1 TaxID=2817656 RepID=UPI001D06E81E|nr:DUF302 domain-containing protein [Marinobacter sp. CA1]UDL05943.1 DUF302 domain-containing protein [Marinobacter sp. CA1]
MLSRRSIAPLLALVLASVSLGAQAADGLVRVASEHSVAETADRLVTNLEARGMTVFDRIDHRAGAEGVGLTLPPTEVVVFGNPKAGTPLMHCAPSVAIDLPLKALVWQDADGNVWLGYNDPAYLAERHNIEGCDAVLAKMTQALANFARQATTD